MATKAALPMTYIAVLNKGDSGGLAVWHSTVVVLGVFRTLREAKAAIERHYNEAGAEVWRYGGDYEYGPSLVWNRLNGVRGAWSSYECDYPAMWWAYGY